MNDKQETTVKGRPVDDWMELLSADGLNDHAQARVLAKLKEERPKKHWARPLFLAAAFTGLGAAAAAATGVVPRLFERIGPQTVPPAEPVKSAYHKQPVDEPVAVDASALLQRAVELADQQRWQEVSELLSEHLVVDSPLGPELVLVASRADIELGRCQAVARRLDGIRPSPQLSGLRGRLKSLLAEAESCPPSEAANPSAPPGSAPR